MNLTLSILTIVVVLIIAHLIYKFIYKPKQINKTKPTIDPVKNNLEALSQVEVDVKSKEIKKSAYNSENTKVIEVYNSMDSGKKQEDGLNNILPFVTMATLTTDNKNTLTEENVHSVELNTDLPVEIPVQIATEAPVEIIIDHRTIANVNNEPVVQDNTIDLTTYQPSPSSAPSYESSSYSNDSSRYSSKSDYNSNSSSSSSDSYSSSDSSSSSSDY